MPPVISRRGGQKLRQAAAPWRPEKLQKDHDGIDRLVQASHLSSFVTYCSRLGSRQRRNNARAAQGAAAVWNAQPRRARWLPWLYLRRRRRDITLTYLDAKGSAEATRLALHIGRGRSPDERLSYAESRAA